jgi:RimJ/RimL family protein N-acetyltransferase
VPTIKQYEATIYTHRLRLAPLMATDAKVMFPILSDRELYSFTGDEPPKSESTLETRYRKLESRKSPDGSELWLNWLVSLGENSVSMGYIQTTVSESHADIAWLIGLKWQGNGYASEAATALVTWLRENGVDAIRCCIYPDHVASQGVASNAGLHKTTLIEDGEDVWVL